MSLADKISNPFDGVRIVPGFADVFPMIRVGGAVQPATWPQDVYATPGDPILVAYIMKPDAPAQAVVLFVTSTPGPREATVTVVPGGSDTITVNDGANDYTATFLQSYTPVNGDRVRLLWQGSDATVLGKVGVTPGRDIPAPQTAAPPPPKASGTFSGVATDSATWWGPGGWGSWAGGGTAVFQGDFGSGPVYGAWFYAGAFSGLAGANITRIQMWVPARKSVGAYNSPGTLHIYAHTSGGRPAGDVSRVYGPYDWTIPAGWAGGFIDLPLAVVPTLIAGGGLSIAGSPYIGLKGKAEDPASGQVLADWNRL